MTSLLLLNEGSDDNYSLHENHQCLVKERDGTIFVNCSCTGFLQVLLQRIDANNLNDIKNITTTHSSCNLPAVFNNQANGSYLATVFHSEKKDYDILEEYFVGQIDVGNNHTESTENDIPDNIDKIIYTGNNIFSLIL